MSLGRLGLRRGASEVAKYHMKSSLRSASTSQAAVVNMLQSYLAVLDESNAMERLSPRKFDHDNMKLICGEPRSTKARPWPSPDGKSLQLAFPLPCS